MHTRQQILNAILAREIRTLDVLEGYMPREQGIAQDAQRVKTQQRAQLRARRVVHERRSTGPAA